MKWIKLVWYVYQIEVLRSGQHYYGHVEQGYLTYSQCTVPGQVKTF